MPKKPSRPVFLNLLQITQPVTAVTSIGHRVTGVLLFFALPVGLYLLELSLQDAGGFAKVKTLLVVGPGHWLAVLVFWGLFYHLLAGLRVMLIENGIGDDLRSARRSAFAVHGLAAAALIAGGIWL